IRTLALLSGFAWFANQGAKFGDTTLAANHVLLQFISLSAFFLDGFAYVVEMLAGRALGAQDRDRFARDLKHATQLAGGTALLLARLVGLGGGAAIEFLTTDPEIGRASCRESEEVAAGAGAAERGISSADAAPQRARSSGA